jgi:hypothetical protein
VRNRSLHTVVDPNLEDWLLMEVSKSRRSMSEVIRRQLWLAYKYRRAIAHAESTPPERFRNNGR